jgi:hypothetical protein
VPVIPLPTQFNPLPDAPAPVLDNLRRPTVDKSSVVGAIRELGEAGKRAPVNPNAFAAPYEALGTVGQSLQQAGSVAGALALERIKAQTYVQVNQAASKRKDADAQFAIFTQQNQNKPETWEPERQRLNAEVSQSLLKDDALTPTAKALIAQDSATWATDQNRATMVASAKQQFGLAGDTNKALLEQNIIDQRTDDFEHNLQVRLENGWGDKDAESEALYLRQKFKNQGERQQKQEQAAAYDAATNNAIGLTLTMGAEKAHQAIDRGEVGAGLDPQAREKLHKTVREADNNNAADISERAANDVDGGKYTSAEQFDADYHGNPFYTPSRQAYFHDRIEKRNDAELQKKLEGDRLTNGGANYAKAFTMVQGYDKSNFSTELEFHDAARDIRSFINDHAPKDDAGWLKAELYRKESTRPKEDEGDAISKNTANEILGVVFDPTSGVLKYKNDDGTEDSKMKIANIIGMGKVKKELMKWQKTNPEDAANGDKIRDKINSLLPEGTQSNAARVFRKSTPTPTPTPTPSKATSYGYPDDSTPDRNSANGIGAFVPDTEAEKIKAGQNSDFKLRSGDIAVSPDVEQAFRSQGVKPGDSVFVTLANGERRKVRWMDRTAQDDQIRAGKIKGVTEPLRGRFDFYSPHGKSRLDGEQVTGWEPA